MFLKVFILNSATMLYNYSCSCFNLTLSQLCEIPKQGNLEVGPKNKTDILHLCAIYNIWNKTRKPPAPTLKKKQ